MALSLSDAQRGLLTAVVDRHAESLGPVARETVAAAIDRHPVTVSMRMQQLRALGLVESTSGPKGGYEPTLRAYDVLADRADEAVIPIPVTSGGEHIEGVRARDLTLNALHRWDDPRGELVVEGSIEGIAAGDSLAIGPIPRSRLYVEGKVVETDPAAGVVVFAIDALSVPMVSSTPRDRDTEPSEQPPDTDATSESLSG